jgi:hypothetical protein
LRIRSKNHFSIYKQQCFLEGVINTVDLQIHAHRQEFCFHFADFHFRVALEPITNRIHFKSPFITYVLSFHSVCVLSVASCRDANCSEKPRLEGFGSKNGARDWTDKRAYGLEELLRDKPHIAQVSEAEG